MSIEVRRAADRFVTRAEGRTTWHSFSFGAHYAPANIGFGTLIAHNDELLPPGTGYPDHPHADTEIVTLVLEGALRHTDDHGHSAVLTPGQVGRLSAGSGVVHAEVTEPGVRTRFLQTWVRPDSSGAVPSYASADYSLDGLVQIAGPGGVVSLGTAGASLFAGTVVGSVALPEAPLLHLFLISGSATVGDRLLSPGDAARLTDQGGRVLEVEEPSTVALWALSS